MTFHPRGPAASSGPVDGSPGGGESRTDAGLLLLALIWGVNFSVIKIALGELHPLAFNALRFPLAALVLYVLLRARGPLARPDRDDLPRIVALGILGHVVYQLLFITGVDLTSAGNASLLLATTPVWTLLLSVARGHERPTALVWVGVFGTLGGMVLVVTGGEGVGGGSLRGDLLMVAASLGWSFYTVGSRTLVQRYGALPMTAWTLWIGAVGVVLVGAPWVAGTPLGDVSPGAWGGIAYAGALGIAVSYLLWYNGVRRLGNARTAVYSNVVPVVALAAAWLWLGEVPTTLQLTGASVILLSLSVARFGGRRSTGGGSPVPPEST